MERLNEDNNTEYKEDIPKKANQLKAEISSFLNSNTGGTIFLGVNDEGKPINFLTKEEKMKKIKNGRRL